MYPIKSHRRSLRIALFALAMLATFPVATSAQVGQEWVGKRVITRFGAVLQADGLVVDDEKLENRSRGGQRREFRIYRVEQVEGPWILIKQENGSAFGWITAGWLIPHDRAIDFFTNEIRANPDNSSAYIYRGHLWKDAKRYENAIADYSDAIRRDPGNEGGWLGRGIAWAFKNEFEKAIADIDEAIRLDPKYALAYYNRGNTWFRKTDYDKAIIDLDLAIQLEPKFAPAYFNRGNAWRAKKEYDKAITDFDEAIRLDPMNTIAYNNRGNAWSAKGESDKAIADYGEAIRLDPMNAVAYNNRGNAWRTRKDYDKAINDYDEAIRREPRYANAFYNRGNAWYDKKEYDEAISDYGEAVRFDPRDRHSDFYRSVCQLILHQPESTTGFKAILDRDQGKGDNSPYALILGNLAARQAGNESEARAFLERASSLDRAAWPFPAVKFLQGELDEAGLLSMAVDDLKRTEARCFLGLDHLLKGQKDEALAHLRWVRDHGVSSTIGYDIALAELARLNESTTPTRK
jgi:tetratricopeptide (TPR) repeat protein